jgi:hypothetical protein
MRGVASEHKVSLKSAMKGPRHEAIAERARRALLIMMGCVV